MDCDNRKRLNVDIPEETFFKLQRLLPFGYKTSIFAVLVEALVHELETEPEAIIALIMSKRITLQELIKGDVKERTTCPKCLGTGFIKRKEQKHDNFKRP